MNGFFVGAGWYNDVDEDETSLLSSFVARRLSHRTKCFITEDGGEKAQLVTTAMEATSALKR